MFKNCKICGNEFEFTEGEAQFYQDRNLNEPKRCPLCRNKRLPDSRDKRIAELEAQVRELQKQRQVIVIEPTWGAQTTPLGVTTVSSI